jgi:hypothetical protein
LQASQRDGLVHYVDPLPANIASKHLLFRFALMIRIDIGRAEA